MCVTLDHDFHAHLAMTGHGQPSVVLLRVQGLDAHGQADLIRSVLIQCEKALSEGAAVSAKIARRSASAGCPCNRPRAVAPLSRIVRAWRVPGVGCRKTYRC